MLQMIIVTSYLAFLVWPLTLSGLLTATCAAASVSVSGRVVDSAGAAVAAARLTLDGGVLGESGGDGSFRIPATPGRRTLRVEAKGLGAHARTLEVPSGGLDHVEIVLAPASLAERVTVSANLIAGTSEEIARIPGSVDVLDAQTLREARLFTFDEALRRVPGLHVRSEEGFGLRPNIGIRGLNPTRSSRVLLLEDGLPLAYAPYGDNASYYHPPIDRFDGVEVVKGGGQILYGPMTVGGVIN